MVIYRALVAVTLVAVAGCGSTGNAQPAPSGAAGSADTAICQGMSAGSPGPTINDQLNQASPDLSALVNEWEAAYAAYQEGDPSASASTVAQDAANVDGWCAQYGLST
jgi:hypothetical protein